MARKKTPKMTGIEKYVQMVDRMVAADRELTTLYEQIEDMCDGTWSLPDELMELDWVGPVVSTDPDSSLETGVRTIAAEDPKWFITQMAPGEDNKDTVNRLERWIAWQWQWSDYRNDKDTTKDIVRSALTYGRVCLHVTHVGQQLEGAGLDKDPLYEDIKNYGDFNIRVCNPKNVHFKRGQFGLDAVAHVYRCRASEAIEDYKGLSKELEDEYEKRGFEDFEVEVVDLTTREKRVVWVVEYGVTQQSSAKTNESPIGPARYVFMDEKRDTPFVNWAIRSGGTALRSDPRKQVKPMLAKIVDTKLWDIQNTVLSLTYSEAISTVAQPRFAVIGPNNNIVRVDYHDPSRLLDVPEGHQVIQLNPRGIDEGLLHLSDRIKAMMDRETVARFLQNLDIPDEAAYASINAVMQSAIAALDVYKDLAELAHADIAILMLKFMHYRKDASVIYGVGTDAVQESVSYTDYDPRALFIQCELSAKAPTDYMQRINAGVAMRQNLKTSTADVFRWIGETDPESAIERYTQEQINDFVLQLRFEEMKIQLQEQAQERLMAKQQQMAEQQMAQQQMVEQQMAQQQTQTLEPPGRSPEERAAFAMARDSGNRFNPREGGTPAAMTNPGATREMISGVDRRGNQVR